MPASEVRISGRHLLVQFDILFELRDHRTGQHVHFALFIALQVRQGRDFSGKELAFGQLFDAGAIDTLNQHLDGAVWQLQKLQDGRDRPHPVQVLDLRIVDVRLLLGHQENTLVGLHGQIQCDDGLFAPDEQRNHHVRVNHYIAQRQNRRTVQAVANFGDIGLGFIAH